MAEEGMGGRGRGEKRGRRKGPEREGEGRKREGPHDPLAWGPPNVLIRPCNGVYVHTGSLICKFNCMICCITAIGSIF